MDATKNQMELTPSQKQAALRELLSLLMPADSTADQAQMSEEEKLKAAYALNLCTVSVSQIIDYNDIFFLEQEYEAILNNLNLEEMPKDEALLRILKQLLDVITYFRIQEGEKKLLEKEYQQKMKNAIWNAVPNIGMIVAGGNPITMAISLASQVGIGYMNYRREKAKIGLEQESKEWELQRSAMEQFNGLRRELFDTAWRLADRYKFPDSYRLTERQITQYNRILMDADDQRRYDRLFYVKDSFAAYPPFWYYLGSAANAVYQDADRYGTEVAERYKGYAKDAFQKFLGSTKRNLLREDQLEASCALELFDLLELGEKQEKLQLLERAKRASGNAFDVLELCAMSYLKIGEARQAADLFRMLVNEDYNTKVNAQLLSKIYVYQAIKDSSADCREEYRILQLRVGSENLFPLPDINCTDVFLEGKFLADQKNLLREKYVTHLTAFMQKCCEEYDTLLKTEGNIAKKMLAMLESMCDAVKTIAPDRVFRRYIETAINGCRKEFQEMLMHSNPGGGRQTKVAFQGIAKDALDNLAKYVGQRITDMETMSEIAENEMELERFRVDNHLPSNDSSQVKALTVNHRGNTLERILLDESFKNRQMMLQKSEECVSAIREIVETKRLINPEKKTNTYFYIKGDHHFDTYLRKNGKALMNAGCENLESIIAILNDRSIWDSDLIFTTYNVILFEKKKHKGSILYIEAEKHYTNDRLNFGGNSFLNGSVDLCVLREVTDALAVVHNNYRVQANENLSELIRSVKNHILGNSYQNEFAMPPKAHTVNRVEVENSLLKTLRKGIVNK